MDSSSSALTAPVATLMSTTADERAGARAGRFYRPELDGLRFFAFVAVYMEHTLGNGLGASHRHIPVWAGEAIAAVGVAGTFGVDLFFVLSSYLITELLLRERIALGVLDVKAFYIRRMLRIWPLYIFFVFVAYAIAFLVPGEGLTWKHVLGYLFFVGNWTYFLMPVNTVAGPLWSVALEEQFYLIWPWVVRKLPARRLAVCAAALIVLATLMRLLMGIVHPDQDWVSKNSFTRVDGIAVGALLAVGLRGGVPSLGSFARAALLASCVAVLLAVAYTFGLFNLPVALVPLMLGWPIAALACGGIVYCVIGSSGPFFAPLRSTPLVYLGRISFGLYVYHELVLKLGELVFPHRDTSPAHMLAYWAFGLLVTIPVAAASYRWLELPFLRLKRARFTRVESRPD